MSYFKKYRRKQIAELRQVQQHDIDDFKSSNSLSISSIDGVQFKVSISDVDLSNGSPKLGDMIARNVNNHNDQWLVAKSYFEENFEELNNFDIIGNNKERRVFKIPIKSSKKWWEFWKKSKSHEDIKHLLKKYKETYTELDLEKDYFLPIKKSK